MSDPNGTCEYVLDPDDPETWGGEEGDECYVDEDVLNEDGVWTCPHDAEEGENLCIFHLPVEEKDNEEVVDAFLDALDDAVGSDVPEIQKQKLQFLGARFGTFDLSDNSPEVTVEEGEKMDIKLKHSTFAGEASFCNSNLETKNTIDFSGSNFVNAAQFNTTVFNSSVIFTGTLFKQSVEFKSTKFIEYSIFDKCEFREEADFSDSTFNGVSWFESVKFCKDVTFEGANFGDNSVEYDGQATFDGAQFFDSANFKHSKFDGGASFREVLFENNLSFHWSQSNGPMLFSNSIFSESSFSDTDFKSTVDFRSSTFNNVTNFSRMLVSDEIGFDDAEFNDRVLFIGAEFRGGCSFKCHFEKNATFSESNIQSADFNRMDLSGSDFLQTDLTDSVFVNSNLCDTNLENSQLSRTTLFGADLRGARLSGTVLGDVRIDEETKFLGHSSDDSDTSPHTLSAIRSRPKCVYDPDYEEDNEHEDVDKAKSVYRALEELGGKHARPRLQARSFVRRQDLQKDEYKQDAKEAESWEERFIAGARWSRARVARATLLYGESPWRVIAWSLGIIFSFALLYPLGGWMKAEEASEPLSYSQIPVSFLSEPLGWLGGFLNILGDSLYYSTLTYTALGFGDFQPEGFGRLLTTVETGLGAVMLALLVFILGRRAAR